MQGNDLLDFSSVTQGVIFEGVLAIPPTNTVASTKAAFFKNRENWSAYLRLWEPNELPLKAMIDSATRLGVCTDVYTFVSQGFAEEIDKLLMRKGISVAVLYYGSVEELAYDLRFQRQIRTIYTATEEQASVIGIRSHVVDPKKAWIS